MVIAIGIPNPGVESPRIVDIRPVIGISYRVVEPPVRPVIHQTESESRSGEEAVEWAVDIMPVVHVDKTSESVKESSVVVVHIQTAYASEPTVIVPDIDPTDLRDPTVVIVEYR